MKILHYSLVFALVAAPMLATDEQDDSNQPKTFWDRCCEQRYAIIGVGAALVATAIAAVCINHYLTTGKLPIDPTALIKSTETPKVEVPQTSLPQESKGFVYPYGYSKESQNHVEDLKKVHNVFAEICCGECKTLGGKFFSLSPADTFDCAQAVNALEEMYKTGEETGNIIASIAMRELNSTILDPIERENTRKLIEQTANKLCPVPATQLAKTPNPAPAQSTFGFWDYWDCFLNQE